MNLDLVLGEDKAFHIEWNSTLANPARHKQWLDLFEQRIKEINPDLIVGVASRGHLFGLPTSLKLGIPYSMIYKDRPFQKPKMETEVESILVVDDIICHGTTMNKIVSIVEKEWPGAIVKPLVAVHIQHEDNKYSKKCGIVSINKNVEDCVTGKQIEDCEILSLVPIYDGLS